MLIDLNDMGMTGWQGESLGKAGALAFRTARLPLQEHLAVRTHILNIDSVLIALNEVANHGDWPRAFAQVIPKRFAQATESASKGV